MRATEASNERGDADGYSPKESALLDEIERNDNDIGKRLKQKHYSPAAGMKTHNRRVVEELLEGADGYLLKPMNCPHHIKIYAARQR
ncbi:MAG: hypothetical protein HYR83_08555, partial [Planctomycetes bacterium]|nr:hypothetical protein [Planctomycetota bacterium]